jgi:hypothetical protein
MPTSTDLMRLARACADRISPPGRTRQFPSFSEVEEQCGDEYEELLTVLHEDELFAPADLDEQERLVEAIRRVLPEVQHRLVETLIDNQAAQVWLQQEGAFHLGMAVGLRLAQQGYRVPDDSEPDPETDEEEREREDAMRFGNRGDARFAYDEDDEDQDEDDEDDTSGKDPRGH